jgi:hypothetical protein
MEEVSFNDRKYLLFIFYNTMLPIRPLCFFFLLVFCYRLNAQTLQDDSLLQVPPVRTQAVLLGSVPALRTLTPSAFSTEKRPKTWERRNHFVSNEQRNTASQPRNGDPLAQSETIERSVTGPELALFLELEGLRDPGMVDPPDPSGDVGKNHYVQMVNSTNGAWMQVWDKAGQSVLGPIMTNTIWSQVGSGSIGDPIVQYDHDAERWLIMEMQGFEENQVILAISENSDPTGEWKVYRIQCLGFPDYPKLYVWNNAYFITVNEIVNSNQCVGYALNRTQILAGADEIDTYRFSFPNYLAIQYQPATGVDWELGPPPPAGTPGMILRVYDDAWDGGQDRIQMWQVVVDWENLDESYSVGPTNFNVAPFETRVCHGFGLFDCLEQPDHPESPRLTALENIVMYRAPYVNYGTHESIVFNHVSDVSSEVGDGGDAAVRWYELRRLAGQGNWTIHQQGTYAPDSENRFMGALSLDVQGNIGLGYSVVSEATYPGIRLTGRRAGDPLGQMTAQEFTLADGFGSHFASSRWGDYSSMAVDPEDGRTFWYVGEYQATQNEWGTRITKFMVQRDSFDIRPVAIETPVTSSLLAPTPVTVRIGNLGIMPAEGITAELYFDGVLADTDTLTTAIDPNGAVLLTFAPNFSWNSINEEHTIKVVTTWYLDDFINNDTLTTVVKRLPERDVAVLSSYNLPNLVCTPDANFGVIVRNLSGLPLDSFKLLTQLNNLPIQTTPWYGHLLPGELDTLPIQLTGITGTQSSFWAKAVLPNGAPDQNMTNDSLGLRIYSNLNGQYLRLEAQSEIGILRYEIRNLSGTLFASGEFSPGFSQRLVCAPNDKCYNLILKSSTLNWSGQFNLYDLFGQSLVTTTVANNLGEQYPFCTPERLSFDVGATALIQPMSANGLGTEETVVVRVTNFGLEPAVNPEVSWQMANGTWQTETLLATIAPGDSKEYTFIGSSADLNEVGNTYSLEIKATISTDEATENDQRLVQVTHYAQLDASVQITRLFSCSDRNNLPNFIEVRNHGLDSIVTYRLTYQLNDVIHQLQVDLLPPLKIGESSNHSFTLNNAQLGNNLLKVTLDQVNGPSSDMFAANNEAATLFSIGENGVYCNLYLVADQFPQQTTWEIVDANTNLVEASGGPYTTANIYYSHDICLDDQTCYKLRIKDAAGNGFSGILGLINMTDFTNLVSYVGGDQNFTNVWEQDFCLDLTCKNFAATFDIQPPTDEQSTDGSITVLPSGNYAPSSYTLENTTQISPVFTGVGAGTLFFSMFSDVGCFYSTPIYVDANRIVPNTAPHVSLLQLMLQPNPTSELVWLSMPAYGDEREVVVEVINAQGQQVRRVLATRFGDELRAAWGMGNQAAGLYFVRATDELGRVVGQNKLLKVE